MRLEMTGPLPLRRLPLAGWATVAVLLAGSGCGGASRSQSSVEASCADVLEWQGNRYLGHGSRVPVQPGEALVPATRLGCDDGNGASPDAEVRVARLAGVEPSVALAAPGDARAIYVRDGQPVASGPLPPVLERALYGPRCDAERPFTLEGALVGSSNLDEGFSVSIDVDAAEGDGRRYLGLPIVLRVDDSTAGLSEREELRPGVGEEWRLRAAVSCVEGERPTETYLAERVARVEREDPPKGLGRLHCPGGADAAPCEQGAEVGVWYPFDLYVHCGVRDAYFDGRSWVLQGGPLEKDELRPGAISDPWTRGLITLLSEVEAEFKGGGFKLGLVPAPDAYERAACD